MFSKLIKTGCIGLVLLFTGCSSANPNQDSSVLYGADDTVDESVEGVSGNLPIGSTLKTTTAVNFRKGPSTAYSVIRVLPEDTEVISVDVTQPTNKFYKVKQQGTVGWVHGAYLEIVSAEVVDSGSVNDPGRSEIISRAKSSVGYSYYWGHGSWRADGSNHGSCSGSCPSCSHSGIYGADCSGMVAKAWTVPSSNSDITDDQHPYSTSSFANDTSQWKTISRSSLQSADALVYNNGSSGHIVIYESGDGWGSMWVYECKGCSYGCVHDLRSLSSSYHGIKKAGL